MQDSLYHFDLQRASHIILAFLNEGLTFDQLQAINDAEHESAHAWPVTPEIDEEVWSLTDRRWGDEQVPSEEELNSISRFNWDLVHLSPSDY